ncbi:MAG: UDP-N-acetylmuramoyl-L-alanine--D-glutamate ligase [Candidatus Omnitrophica bacterium]|nr:UDP-N-acetylmuramoyl-L-alanine--D-glutamate ligase [Candidatus Omnitrophota bacterium]
MQDLFGRSWAGRRVVVVGLGRSGTAAAELLVLAGALVKATEVQQTDAVRTAAAALSARGVDVETGRHTPKFLDGVDAMVVSPGVPEHAEPLEWALEKGLPVLSEIELAFAFCPSPVVAVTGTNGKSTVVTLIAHLLQRAGRTAVACGNLGVPFASVVPQLTPQTIAVVEVSSFQLLRCEQFRPRIGALLNLGTNHLDRHQDRAAYLAAKARLFQRQTPKDWAVLNALDPAVAALGERLRAQRIWFGDNRSNPAGFRLAARTQEALPLSAQAALQVARILGVADPAAWQAIRSYRSLEHRQEHVATVRGVRFINDSKSTTPESLLFAFHQTRGEVVIIAGGRDKGLDFGPMVDELHDGRVKGVVLIGESRKRFRALFNGSSVVRESPTLDDAVHTAASLAGPGTTVLFSPACASFDMFRDFEDRGRAFKAIIQKLSEGAR